MNWTGGHLRQARMKPRPEQNHAKTIRPTNMQQQYLSRLQRHASLEHPECDEIEDLSRISEDSKHQVHRANDLEAARVDRPQFSESILGSIRPGRFRTAHSDSKRIERLLRRSNWLKLDRQQYREHARSESLPTESLHRDRPRSHHDQLQAWMGRALSSRQSNSAQSAPDGFPSHAVALEPGSVLVREFAHQGASTRPDRLDVSARDPETTESLDSF